MTEKPKQTSGLVVHELTFWEATMIIVGANIGSGILGIALFSASGRFPNPVVMACAGRHTRYCFHAVCGGNIPAYT